MAVASQPGTQSTIAAAHSFCGSSPSVLQIGSTQAPGSYKGAAEQAARKVTKPRRLPPVGHTVAASEADGGSNGEVIEILRPTAQPLQVRIEAFDAAAV